MNIQVESYGHAVMLILKGELTADSLGAIRRAVDHQLKDQNVIDVLFNMEKVNFIDSAAMEYLLDLSDQLAERLGLIKLVKPNETVRKILEIIEMDATFEIFSDVPQAVKAIQN